MHTHTRAKLFRLYVRILEAFNFINYEVYTSSSQQLFNDLIFNFVRCRMEGRRPSMEISRLNREGCR